MHMSMRTSMRGVHTQPEKPPTPKAETPKSEGGDWDDDDWDAKSDSEIVSKLPAPKEKEKGAWDDEDAEVSRRRLSFFLFSPFRRSLLDGRSESRSLTVALKVAL